MTGMRLGRAGLWAAAAVGLMALGGCGKFATGLWSDEPQPDMSSTSYPTSTQASTTPLRIQMDPDAECPQINVPIGGAAWPAGDTSSRQLSFSKFARQCILEPGNVIKIHIGVEVRGILGPKGSAGSYSAPVRITVRDRDGTSVYSRVHTVTVSIPGGNAGGTASFVDDASRINLANGLPLNSYDIQLGFGGGAEGRAVSKRRRRS